MQTVTLPARTAFDTSPIKRKYKCFIDWITKGDTPGVVTAGEWDSTYFAKENAVNDETYARFKSLILSDSMRLGDNVRLVSNKYENGWLGANRSDVNGEFADIEIADSYSESNYSTQLYYCSGTEKGSQSFTGKAGNLVSCKWYLRKYGSPTGNIVAKLYAHSGTYGVSSIPTGEPLATSNTIDITTLSTSLQLTTFSFEGAEQYLLVNGTYYCLVIEFSGGDTYNCLKVGADRTSPTHSGNIADYSYGNWDLYPNYDFIFYVYIYGSGVTEDISEIYTSTIQTTHLTVFGSQYNFPVNMDLYYRDSTNTNWVLCSGYIGLTSYITYYTFPAVTTIKGWKVEISKISLADMPACIVEVMTGFREDVSSDLTAEPMEISKELEYSGASVSLGNISANTLTLRLNNTSQKYNPENIDSYLYPFLKYNKIIYSYIGIDLGDSIEWFAQGKYYLKEIDPKSDMTVEFYAVDKMILMNEEDFESSLVYEDYSKDELVKMLVEDFGLGSTEYSIDLVTPHTHIPYAYFIPRKYAENIKRLELSDGGVAFFDELGLFNSKTRGWTEVGVAAYYDDSNIKKNSASSPVMSSSMKNYIRIKSNPLYEQVQQEVYSLTQNITIPANGTRDVACYFNKKPCRVVNIANATYAPMGVGITITTQNKYSFVTFLTFTNSTGADVDVTSISILAQPLEATGANEVISQDADLIFIYGKSEYLIDSEFIQDMDYAQELADDLLADYKDPEALEIEIESPSRPYLQLGDTVNVKIKKLSIGE
ncbi:MAG TPA: hypothetical protein VMV86_00560 [Methanosarcinales archaeon]|nr:hypothetical protein [Methanosarcinales archaeon]